MIKDHTNLFIGLILILPGIYLLWYANGHTDFFRERRWEKWVNRQSALLNLLFRVVYRTGGINSVRYSFRLFALICIGVGIWSMFAG